MNHDDPHAVRLVLPDTGAHLTAWFMYAVHSRLNSSRNALTIAGAWRVMTTFSRLDKTAWRVQSANAGKPAEAHGVCGVCQRQQMDETGSQLRASMALQNGDALKLPFISVTPSITQNL